MNGIRAARVHIVLPDEGSFRRARQPPSASVMIRTDTIADTRAPGKPIRHLVAAAVPGMNGRPGDGPEHRRHPALLRRAITDEAAPGKMLTLEKTVV